MVKMTKTTLVVLAAGMGSRFGGTKQIAPLGPNGEILIEFSIFDAVKAGFDKVVMIVKKENKEDIKNIFAKRIDKLVSVEYVYQELTSLPDNFVFPKDRTKPWGTAHAVLCCKDRVDTPFGIINADDFYGYESFKLLHDHLVSSTEMCNVGFRLGATLTDNGSVSRGICSTEDGYLTDVTEIRAITKNSGIPLDSICSMNMWGLFPSIFPILEEEFRSFYLGMNDPQKDECYLPTVIDTLIRERGEKVKLIPTTAEWFGVTYQADAPLVKRKLLALVEKGMYKGL